MARTNCECGTVLTNHSIPNDIQLTVYTRKEWEKMCENGATETWLLPSPRYDVWRCPVCRRIAVYDWEDPAPLLKYELEAGEYEPSDFFAGDFAKRAVCKCGAERMEGQDSKENEFLVYTDFEWDKICTDDIIEPRNIQPPRYSVWRCPKCERIMVYEGEKLAMVYVLEESQP